MTISLQKASLWKRISAYLFDVIIAVMVTVGFATALAGVLNYDGYTEQLGSYYAEYEKDGIDFDISDEDYNKLSEEEKAKYEEAKQAFASDERVLALYNTMFNVTLAIAGGSLLLTHLILYFAIPLFFKNGQTLGKKIFGLAVIRTNCVKATNPVLFIRAIVGQCAMETMVPALLLIMIFFGVLGSVGTITLFLLLALQLGVMIATKTNSTIHDLLTDTVVVDFASQQIFETEEARIAFIEEMQREEVQSQHTYSFYKKTEETEETQTDEIPSSKE